MTRLSCALLGASLGGLLAATLDTAYALTAFDAANAPSLLTLLPLEIALMAPVVWVVGLAVGGFIRLIEPDRAHTPRGILRALSPRDPVRAARLAAVALVAPLGVVLWATALAQWSRVCLASAVSPRAAGIVVALGAILLASMVMGAVLAASRLLAVALEQSSTRQTPPALGLAGVALAAAVLAWGIGTGA